MARAIIGTSEPENIEIAKFLDNLDFNNMNYTKPIETEKVREDKISFKKSGKKQKKRNIKDINQITLLSMKKFNNSDFI